MRLALHLLSAILLAAAFLVPETHSSAVAGIASAAVLAYANRSGSVSLWNFFWFGTALHAIAFYWLPQTVAFFGGFPYPAALAVFALFCITGALQFVLCGWLMRRLEMQLGAGSLLSFPLAWFVSETVYPRLFPWYLAHVTVHWQPFVGLAQFGGVLPITFLVALLGAVVAELVCKSGLFGPRGESDAAGRNVGSRKLDNPKVGIAGIVIGLALLAGVFSNRSTEQIVAAAPSTRAALIQGNLAAKQKGDVHYFDVNLARYRELSVQAIAKGADVLLWPESVVNRWMEEAQPSIAETALAQTLMYPVPLLYGGLAFRPRPEDEFKRLLEQFPQAKTGELYNSLRYLRFNSAFMVTPAGAIVGRYHKRVLMPFGEYMPFADIIPAIKELSPMTGDFSKGDLLEPLQTEVATASGAAATLRAGALICYEDLVPALSNDAVLRGANVLVNITNDAWYGATAAPYQHHLLAQWRAAETRRYLLRVTNTGVTAIVDPFGRTVAVLPIFTEGVLTEQIRLLEGTTLYAHLGNIPWMVAAWGTILALVFLRLKRSA